VTAPLAGFAQDGEQWGHCAACRARIVWRRTPAGKWTPVNEDGTPHWVTCPFADSFRKKPRKAARKVNFKSQAVPARESQRDFEL